MRDILLWGIILAAMLTFVVNLPSFLEWHRTGRTDIALVMSVQGEDEARYVSRIREFSDGQILMGNPFAKEHRSDLPPGGFAEYAIAIPMSLFHLSITQAIALTEIIFPFFIFLLTYLWSYAGLRSKMLSTVFLLIFTLEIGYGIMRDAHPKITLIPFSLYLCTLFWFQRSRCVLLLRGFLLGVMFYTYPYHWAYLLVFEAVDAFTAFLSRRSFSIAIQDALSVFGPFLACAVPWIILVRSTIDPAIIQQAYEHLGLIATRIPVAPWLQMIVGIWCIVTGSMILTKLRADSAMRTIFLLLSAALISLNSNFITGSESEFLGHFGRVFSPFLFFAAILTVQALFKKKTLQVLSYFMIVFSLVGIASVMKTTIDDVPRAVTIVDSHQAVLAYINRELPNDSVILAPMKLSQILPVYTTAYPFMSNATHFFFVPEREMTDRYLAFAALFPEEMDTSDSRYVPVFGNNPGALWAKARTWHAILKMFGRTDTTFTSTQGDFAQDQELRRRIDSEILETDWGATRTTLASYTLDYVLSGKTIPVAVQDMFTRQATIGRWILYKRKSL